MVYLSIVIPAYKSETSIGRLLTSICQSKNIDYPEIEIIVVDDKSTDKTISEVQKFAACKKGKKFAAVKVVALRTNSGPAVARNTGVKYSRGKVVLFLDSDVVVYRNTVFEVVNSFKKDVDLFALTGVWSKVQKNHQFFPKFKALRDWSYWINERDPKNYYYLFSTRIAAIRRDLFLRLGGFDTTYKAALVEDIELTYRIARRYAVVFHSKAKVFHEFEDFWPIAKKYFWRSYYWSKIYRERKKFDPVATTGKEAMTTISAGMMVGFLILSSLSYLSHLNNATRWLMIALGITTIVHLWGVRKFLLFAAKEEGLVFAVKSFFTGIALYIIILAGAAASMVNLELRK